MSDENANKPTTQPTDSIFPGTGSGDAPKQEKPGADASESLGSPHPTTDAAPSRPAGRLMQMGTERLRNRTYRKYQVEGQASTHDFTDVHKMIDGLSELGADNIVILVRV